MSHDNKKKRNKQQLKLELKIFGVKEVSFMVDFDFFLWAFFVIPTICKQYYFVSERGLYSTDFFFFDDSI